MLIVVSIITCAMMVVLKDDRPLQWTRQGQAVGIHDHYGRVSSYTINSFSKLTLVNPTARDRIEAEQIRRIIIGTASAALMFARNCG